MEYGEKYLTYKGRMVFAKQTMPYFNRVPKEYAANEACFVFVNQGEVSLRSSEKFIDLHNKKAILAKCLNYFFETRESQRTGEGVQAIAVLLHSDILEEIFEFDLATSSYELGYDVKTFAVDSLLENFKESINILIDNPELADENLIKTKLKEFVLLMTKSQNIPSQLDFLAGLFRPVDVSFKKTVQQNLFSNLSVDEMAQLSHLSTSSFKRKFKEVYHESPAKYILSKKIEKAAEMLRSDQHRVSDVAYDVGFDSLATFNRNFAKLMGKSPSEYRLNQIEQSLN